MCAAPGFRLRELSALLRRDETPILSLSRDKTEGRSDGSPYGGESLARGSHDENAMNKKFIALGPSVRHQAM